MPGSPACSSIVTRILKRKRKFYHVWWNPWLNCVNWCWARLQVLRRNERKNICCILCISITKSLNKCWPQVCLYVPKMWQERKEMDAKEWMYVYIHVHIYICAWKEKTLNISICLVVYLYVSLYIYVYSPQMMGPVAHVYYRHAYTYIHIRTYRHMCVWRYINEILYICIYVYIHMSSPDDWAGGIVEKFRYKYLYV